ncbi:hypothetical protein PENTCL1PPCAC_25277, partial [Pristionchus entomophagus]
HSFFSILALVRRLEMENERLKAKKTSNHKSTIIQKTVQLELATQNSNNRQHTQKVDMGGGIELTISSKLQAQTSKTEL